MKKQLILSAVAVALAGLTFGAGAETPLTPKARYAADSKEALTRYESDKKLCHDESSSGARLQCRRDAKAEYDQALAAAKADLATATKATVATKAADGKPAPTQVSCADCATVLAVKVGEKQGEGSPVGMIAGGVAGAVLGRQVGGGMGKDLATIAGAAGGAYAGKKIEEKIKTHKVWTVSVQYADGSKASFDFVQDPGLKAGDPVKKSGNTVIRY